MSAPIQNSENSKAFNSAITPTTTTFSPRIQAESTSDKESLIKVINTEKQFNEMLTSIKDKYIIVEFYASWCKQCNFMFTTFQDVAKKYPDKVEIFKIDIDDLEELAIEYEVNVMPTFMIMRNGKKLDQYAGSKIEKINEMVEKYLEKST